MPAPFRLLVLCFLLLPAAAAAEPHPGPGLALRAIDGDNDVGAHFAIVPRGSGHYTGFFHLVDEGRLVTASCSAAGCSGPLGVASLPGPHRGRGVSAAARTGGRPLAAYHDASAAALVVLDCQTTECSYGIERVVDADGDVGHDSAVAVDPATGLAVISHYDAGLGQLRLYRCATVDCDSGSAVVVDAGGDRGRGSALAFADGGLWIAYEDVAGGELMLARGTAPYAVFSTQPLGPGREPALSVTADGRLDMVFRRPADGALMRRLCSDLACSSAFNTQLSVAGRGHRPSALRSAEGHLFVAHSEPSAGRVHGTLCNDLHCTAPQTPVFAEQAGLGSRVVLALPPGGPPGVFHHDAARGDVLAARCTTPACTAFERRIAFNGLPVGGSRLALRGDGAPLVAYIRERQPWLAVCANPACTLFTRRALPGANSDPRPGLGVRPDGRPFAYFSNVGGSRAFDCSDAACSDGVGREVSGTGNSTGSVLELALRADGRPVLLYTVSNQNDVHVFLCADVDCSSGSARLLVDEPTASTFLAGFALAIDGADHPLALYARSSNGSHELRMARCDDPDCLTATVTTVGTPQNFQAQPLAVRSDDRPVFIDGSYGERRLSICSDPACSTIDRHPLPGQGIVRSLALAAGDRPVFESGAVGGFGLYTRCHDETCSDLEGEVALYDPQPQASFLGSVALRADGAAVLAFDDSTHQDVLLLVPHPPRVFANGFE
jgi:hypothetical protein